MGESADKKATDSAILKSWAKVANKTNSKQDIEISSERIAKLRKVLIDSEKTKS